MRKDILLELERKLKEKELNLPEFVKKKASTAIKSANTLICVAGEEISNIQILVSGELAILNSFSDGKEFVFASENSFTLLGDLEFFSKQMTNASSVITKTDVALVSLDFKVFLEWIESNSRFYDLVVYQLALKCYKGTISQGNIKYETSTSRVIRTLLEISQPQKKNANLLVAECSHYEIARMSGMSERTVNRVLHKLQEEKIILIQYRKISINKSHIPYLNQLQ